MSHKKKEQNLSTDQATEGKQVPGRNSGQEKYGPRDEFKESGPEIHQPCRLTRT
jgi:hypothetical protein